MQPAPAHLEGVSPPPAPAAEGDSSRPGGVAEAGRPAAWTRSILDAVNDAICVTDRDQVVIDFNERFLRLWGIDVEEPGRQSGEAICERVRRRLADAAGFHERLDEIVRSGEQETHDVIELRDGRILEGHSRVQLFEGRPEGRVWSFRDITEQRRAEETLRDREERLRAIVGQASVGIAVAGLDARFQEANRRFQELLGYTAEELRARSFLDITHPDDRAETERMARRLCEGGTDDYALEKRYLRRDGGVVWSRTTVSLIRDPRGAPRHSVVIMEDITQRKQAEEALQRNEAELRALADSMAQLAWMAEPDGRVFWYNRRWFEYTGTTLEQMRGWGWQAVHDPAMVGQVVRRWGRAIEAGLPFEMEFPLRGADEVYRWFLTRVVPVRDAAGRVTRWFGTSTDVDRAKRAEDALREETRVLELLNRTGTAIASQLDLEGLLQTVVRAGTELSGARFGAFFHADPGEEGRGRIFVPQAIAGVHPEALARTCEGRDRFLASAFGGREVLRRDDAPGEVAEAGFPPSRSYVAVPVVSRSGEVLGGLFFGHPDPSAFDARTERVLTGVAAQAAIAIDNARLYAAAQRDIAERARTERHLRKNEARLRVALDTAVLGTWELDVRTGVVELDERCVELFAPAGRASMGLEDFCALAHAEDREARRAALAGVSSGATERYNLEFRLAGTDRWLRTGAKVVRGCGGEVACVIGGVLEITDAVRARATAEERQRELERLVDERTASLHQAIAQMEEFSYSVSHDLRAPLRAIQAYALAVIEDCGDKIGERGLEHLKRIAAAGKRMDRLTLDVLVYSRIARGAAPLTMIALDRLVDEVIEQYAPIGTRPGAIRVEHPLLDVRGHEPLLAQAISNLLANALKFAREGVAPDVRVWTERRDGQVRLWVEDNGIGVRPEHQARIWGMFERIHPPDHYEGTGIGLAIVRKAVERMGGSVGVESEMGRGSRFWIQLNAA